MITSNADAEKTKPTAAKNTSALGEQGLESESPEFLTKPHNLLRTTRPASPSLIIVD